MKGIKFKTIGRKLMDDVSKAKDKKELLTALKDACCKTASREKVEKELERMDFPTGKEVAKLKATMARVRLNNAEIKFQKTLAAAKKPEQVKKLLHKYKFFSASVFTNYSVEVVETDYFVILIIRALKTLNLFKLVFFA